MTTNIGAAPVQPARVREVLGQHVLADGFRLVYDTKASHGCWLVDARDGDRVPRPVHVLRLLAARVQPARARRRPGVHGAARRVAANKPANPDMYTTHLAEFVETFARVLGDPALPHLFFVEGGALAVENALKTAFDWKSRRNEAAGRSPDLGTKVLHLTHAFHGRSGYTMSLTNTDPAKTDRFPKFGWPRIDAPAVSFPLEDAPGRGRGRPRRGRSPRRGRRSRPTRTTSPASSPSRSRARAATTTCGRSSSRRCRRCATTYDALFVLDEVQTGVGLTGTPWAYQQLGLEPDVVAFAKKVQVGGIMAGRRVDDVPDNVFAVSGRINSTWGGGLADMVRSRRLLEIIERRRAVRQRGQGRRLVPAASSAPWASGTPTGVERPRPRADVRARPAGPSATRDRVMQRPARGARHRAACGERSVRFRPAARRHRARARARAGRARPGPRRPAPDSDTNPTKQT